MGDMNIKNVIGFHSSGMGDDNSQRCNLKAAAQQNTILQDAIS